MLHVSRLGPTYIRYNQKFIPNFGERDRYGVRGIDSQPSLQQTFHKETTDSRHEVARRNERMSTLSVVLSCIPGTG